MAMKIYLYKGEIVMTEPLPVFYDDVIISDLNIDDSPIIENGKIIALKGSETHKKQLAESEKMMKKMFNRNLIVNITTENKKKHAVIHPDDDTIDFDEKRGDKKFTSYEEAEKYAFEING